MKNEVNKNIDQISDPVCISIPIQFSFFLYSCLFSSSTLFYLIYNSSLFTVKLRNDEMNTSTYCRAQEVSLLIIFGVYTCFKTAFSITLEVLLCIFFRMFWTPHFTLQYCVTILELETTSEMNIKKIWGEKPKIFWFKLLEFLLLSKVTRAAFQEEINECNPCKHRRNHVLNTLHASD